MLRQMAAASTADDDVLFAPPERGFRQVDEAALVFEQRAGGGCGLFGARGRHVVEAVPPELGDAIELVAEAKDEALQPWIQPTFAVLLEHDGGATETFYVPMRRVEVGPSPGALKAVADVTTVTYKDAINQIDSFEFTINGGAWAPGGSRSTITTGSAPRSR